MNWQVEDSLLSIIFHKAIYIPITCARRKSISLMLQKQNKTFFSKTRLQLVTRIKIFQREIFRLP